MNSLDLILRLMLFIGACAVLILAWFVIRFLRHVYETRRGWLP